MHVMLSALPRVKAASLNFLAAASGSSSVLAMETASYTMRVKVSKNSPMSRSYTQGKETSSQHPASIAYHQSDTNSTHCIWKPIISMMADLPRILSSGQKCGWSTHIIRWNISSKVRKDTRIHHAKLPCIRQRESEGYIFTSLGTTSHSPSLASTSNSNSSSIFCS